MPPAYDLSTKLRYGDRSETTAILMPSNANLSFMTKFMFYPFPKICASDHL